MWVWEIDAPASYQVWRWIGAVFLTLWYTYIMHKYVSGFFINRGWWPKRERVGAKPLSKEELRAMDGWPCLFRLVRKTCAWCVVWGMCMLSSVATVDRWLRPTDGAKLKQQFVLESERRERRLSTGYRVVGEYANLIVYLDDQGAYRTVETESVSRVDIFLGPPPWECPGTKRKETYIRGEDFTNPILETKWGPV